MTTWTLMTDAAPELGAECIVLIRGAAGDLYPAIDEWEMQREAPLSFSSHTIETGPGWNGHDYEDVFAWMPVASYAKNVAAWPTPDDICHNCDTAAPGCGGLFADDGKACRFHGA